MFRLAIAVAAILATSTAAPLAWGVETPPNLKLSGNIYGQFYKYDLTANGVGNNGFDLDQAHLVANYTFDPTWSALIQIGAIRLAGTSSTAPSVSNVYVKQAAMIGKDLWGNGSKLTIGQQINPIYLYLDVPMNVGWLTYSLSLQQKLQNFFDGGVSASGSLGSLKYTVFVSSGEGTFLRPGSTNNALSYQGILGLKLPFGMSLTAVDTFNAGSNQTGPDNYVGGAFISNQRWIDFMFEAGSFTHPDSNVLNPYPGTVVGPISALLYGAIANLKFGKNFSVFGRFHTGTADYQSAFLGGKKSDLLVGPVYTWMGGKLGFATLYNQQPLSDASLLANPSGQTAQSVQVRFEAYF